MTEEKKDEKEPKEEKRYDGGPIPKLSAAAKKELEKEEEKEASN